MKYIIISAFTIGLLGVSLDATADKASEAKAHYKAGKALYKAGNYAEAIKEIHKAYKLKPHPVLLRYMGDTYFKLNKAREAITYYKKYLKEAPQAADRQKVEDKVRQLELIIGSAEEEEEETTPAPAQEPAVEPMPEPAPKTRSNIDMAPTGEDNEVPLALRKKRLQRRAVAPRRTDSGGTSPLTILKWVAAGVGVVGLAMGITFNVLASNNASDLEEAVKNDCPKSQPTCGGNPTMNTPKVQFGETHFNLIQDHKTNQTVSIASFVAGGVGAAAAVLLFVLDKNKKKKGRRRRASSQQRVGVAPVFGNGVYGLSGEISF